MRILSLILIVSMTAALFSGCASGKKTRMTRFYVEYSRGKSTSMDTDIAMKHGNSDYTLHDVYLEDESFFPDNSIIPNAFLKHLIKFKLNDAQKAFTEPYYSYRFIYFLKKNPHIGIGYEFIHHKVFFLDKDQRVRMSGTYKGEPIDETVRAGDIMDWFSVSHGINHISLHLVYRWMLKKTAKIKDGRWQPFVSLSAGPTVPHLEVDLVEDDGSVNRKAYSYQASWRNWGLGFGTGVRFKPWRKLGFYLEYKLTYSHLHGMHFDDMPGSNVKMDFFAHHLQWGLSFMF